MFWLNNVHQPIHPFKDIISLWIIAPISTDDPFSTVLSHYVGNQDIANSFAPFGQPIWNILIRWRKRKASDTHVKSGFLKYNQILKILKKHSLWRLDLICAKPTKGSACQDHPCNEGCWHFVPKTRHTENLFFSCFWITHSMNGLSVVYWISPIVFIPKMAIRWFQFETIFKQWLHQTRI